jgi:hypothetical protein
MKDGDDENAPQHSKGKTTIIRTRTTNAGRSHVVAQAAMIIMCHVMVFPVSEAITISFVYLLAYLRSGGRPIKTRKAILRPSGFSHPATRPLVVYCSVRLPNVQPRVLMRRRPAAQRSWAPTEAGTSHGRRDLLPNARNSDARRQAIAALVGPYGGL